MNEDLAAPGRTVSLIGGGLAALATVGLFLVSCGKWSDAIIDSGREWIVPDALARGDLLYRDVVYWFGPFTPYVHAAFFRLLGSSFRTLVVAGSFGAAGVLAALHAALRQVSDRASSAAWTVLAIPALVFMPQAGGAILGMGYRIWHAAAFALLAVVLGARVSRTGSPGMAFASGVAAGLSGLCRTEWGLAALLSAGLTVALAGRRRSGRLIPPLLGQVGGFVVAFGGALAFFIARAGFRAVVRDAPLLLFNLPGETRANVASLHPSSWARGGAQMISGALLWVGAAFALELVSRFHDSSPERAASLRRLGLLLVLILAVTAIGGVPYGPAFSGAPLLCAGAAIAGARNRKEPGLALAGFGVLGVLTSYRRPFFIADGPYVAPPLLFALVCAAGWMALRRDGYEPSTHLRMAALLPRTVAALAAVAFLGRSMEYLADDRVAIAGTGGMLSASPETAAVIEKTAGLIRTATTPSDGLVVFPEGELLNFLSGRSNPIRHKLYLPGYVDSGNEEEIVAELSRARPRTVVIWPRPLGEYGRGFFGRDYALRIQEWIDRQGQPVPGPSKVKVLIRKDSP